MRITCPNCGAKYEVPDEVIPEDGRDVQCSNCGDTWFQDRASAVQADEIPDESPPLPEDPEPEPEPQEDDPAEEEAPAEVEPPEVEEPPAEEPPEDDTPAEPEEDPGLEEPEDDPEEAPAEYQIAGDFLEDDTSPEDAEDTPGPEEADQDPLPERSELDPAVAGILREEAEHEARLRATEAGGLESQGDLGLDEAPGDEASRRSREARDRMARMRGESATETEPAAQSGSRSGLLPDIEEINSTLRAEDDDGAPPEALEMVAQKGASSGGGFARGFGLMILIAILAVLVYVNADRIAAQVPALAGAVESYVGVIDNLRLWLDTKLSGFIPQ